MDQPLLVLLLPRRLERFDLEQRARELLRAPGVVAVDPSRLPPGRLAPTLAAGLAVGQAKRMRLPGSVAAIAIFHPLQFYLAGALLRAITARSSGTGAASASRAPASTSSSCTPGRPSARR